MPGMRDQLRKRFDWMPADARERSIDETFNTMRTPTPFMVEEGALHIRDCLDLLTAGKMTSQQLAERIFSAMCLRASEGG